MTVRKTGDTNILTIAFVSTDGSMDKQDIADYVASNIQEPLSRVNGVGDITAYGSQYSMRIWLDPAKLTSVQMTAKDVTDAIESQNAQIAVGQLGGTPSVDNQSLNATINAQSLLQTPQQFRDITLRVNPDGSLVTLGDVAKVELGAESYDYLSRYNRNPASGLGVQLASGANEMQTAELVLNRLDELSQYFPHGLEYKIAYETTSFVKASIHDVVKTLLEAIVLVFPGDVPVPAKHPRNAHPNHCRTGGSDGDFRHPVCLRLQYQHPDDVRDGAGDRSAGGRCYRGRRKR